MTTTLRGLHLTTALLTLVLCLASFSTGANGPVGDHVKDLQAHLEEYTGEVEWLLAQVDDMMLRYREGGVSAAGPEALVDHWEAVKFHSAIESNYVPIYASIWQGLFGVRLAMEAGAPLPEVQGKREIFAQSLWQALGAVKMAAEFQQRGYAMAKDTSDELSQGATLDNIKGELDRVVAKFAERLGDAAIDIVHDTYMNRFEGIEGALIEEDAELVESLEMDFNVTLPTAIQDGASVDEVRAIVVNMQSKLDRAKTLLEAAESDRPSIF